MALNFKAVAAQLVVVKCSRVGMVRMGHLAATVKCFGLYCIGPEYHLLVWGSLSKGP